MSDEPANEEEFLDQEARLAREALQRTREDAIESLSRTADVDAWTKRYPWQSLGTAAVAGLGAGWALGSAFLGSSSERRTAPSENRDAEQVDSEAPEKPHATQRLVSGLGTLSGAIASAAFTALLEALRTSVKDSVHEAFNPAQPDDADDDPEEGGPDDGETEYV